MGGGRAPERVIQWGVRLGLSAQSMDREAYILHTGESSFGAQMAALENRSAYLSRRVPKVGNLHAVEPHGRGAYVVRQVYHKLQQQLRKVRGL